MTWLMLLVVLLWVLLRLACRVRNDRHRNHIDFPTLADRPPTQAYEHHFDGAERTLTGVRDAWVPWRRRPRGQIPRRPVRGERR